MTVPAERQRHVVVFDCNVYLDVASLTGPPFTWEKLAAIASAEMAAPAPHPRDRAFDSLRAVASCQSGRFAGNEIVEVWTSLHIDGLVRAKASQTPDAAGRSGLGWPPEHAHGLVDDLIWELLASSGGGTVGEAFPDGNPPLDHEDGKVYGGCKVLASDDPLSRVYCVTRDQQFISSYEDGKLDGHTVVLSSSAFLDLVQKARRSLAFSAMRPGKK